LLVDDIRFFSSLPFIDVFTYVVSTLILRWYIIGGQPCDVGIISKNQPDGMKFRVQQVRMDKENGLIYHNGSFEIDRHDHDDKDDQA
jgi:hypothetical protein